MGSSERNRRQKHKRISKVSDKKKLLTKLSNTSLYGTNDGFIENLSPEFLDGIELESRQSKKSTKPTSSSGVSDCNNNLDKKKSIGVLKLFKYSNRREKLLVSFGVLCSIINGISGPLMSIIFGRMTDTLAVSMNKANIYPLSQANTTSNYPISTNILNATYPSTSLPLSQPSPLIPTRNNTSWNKSFLTLLSDIDQDYTFESAMNFYCLAFTYLGLINFIASFLGNFLITHSSQRIIHRIQRRFMATALVQELSWFDQNQVGSLASILSDDMERIRDGLGDQLNALVRYSSTVISGYLVGFMIDWHLVLVLLCTAPLVAGLQSYHSIIVYNYAKYEQTMYSVASSIAEQAFASIRTVISLNGQRDEVKKYVKEIDNAYKRRIKKYLLISLINGTSFCFVYSAYGLALYCGSLLKAYGYLSCGEAISILMSSMAAATALGSLGAPLQVIINSRASASLVYSILDSKPRIDVNNNSGIKLTKVCAKIRFDKVQFSYPSRPTVLVLKNFSLKLEQGRTIGICGKTGSGKSTIINLLLRFYDPSSGSIYLDNCLYTDLNLAWLRSLVGLVEQEPSLFDASILENIALGAREPSMRTYDKIVVAAKMANAHQFIMSFPDKYNTRCGDRGVQMSGGQKQRIAIARALLSDPKILLLDEATSSLDAESEAQVQEALNKARQNRMTIIVAHRLSTIKDADLICVMDRGVVVEAGQHYDLLRLNGYYKNLVTSQLFDSKVPKQNLNLLKQESIRSELSLLNAYGSDKESIDTWFDYNEIPVTCNQGSYSLAMLKKRRNSNYAIDNNKKQIHQRAKQRVEQYEILSDKSKRNKKQAISFYGMIKPQLAMIIIGAFACAFHGILQIVIGLMNAQIFQVLSQTNIVNIKAGGLFYSLIFVAIALAYILVMYCRIYLLMVGIETITSSLRTKCFKSMLRQDMSWFDMAQNSPQELSLKLASDVPRIETLISSRLITMICGSFVVASSLVVVYYISWQMGLLMTLITPWIIFMSVLDYKNKSTGKTRCKQNNEATKFAVEAFGHVKLIQVLGQERYFVDKYSEVLKKSFLKSTCSTLISSLIFGLTISSTYFVFAATFKYGTYLILAKYINALDMFRCFYVTSMTCSVIGIWIGYGDNVNAGELALKSIIHTLKSESMIDNFNTGGIKPDLQGHVSFTNVHFKYPARSDVPVLQGLTLNIAAGTTVALVGGSGNGKSTLSSLLLRFYDSDSGTIKLDSYDVRCINLEHLRRNVCIVCQEPVLFRASIRDNILYGLDAKRFSNSDLINAAKLANIHEFIESLPQKYDTLVGARGTQLSGGQKQRIAIARAVIRKPKVLILDEATSALDSESEKLVYEALDNATRGRTCIKIAHRLSSIVSSDKIALIEKGRIVEQGSHRELMSAKPASRYFLLMQKQSSAPVNGK